MGRIRKRLASITKVSRLLVDPDPRFVSLVDRGANQTAFAVLKRAEMPVLEGENMAKKTTSKSDVKVTHIHQLEFDGEVFADEEAVKAYLDENGYDYTGTIKSEDGSYIVSGEKEDAFKKGSIRSIKAANGLTIHAGTLADSEDAAKGKDEDKAKKGLIPVSTAKGDSTVAEQTVKFDDFMAYYSNGQTVDDVMADANDGLPPGIYEVNVAFYTALKNVLTGNDTKRAGAVRSLAAEFGDYINKLADVFAAMLADGDEEGASKMADKMLEDATKDAEATASKEDKDTAAEAEADEAAKSADEATDDAEADAAAEADKVEDEADEATKAADAEADKDTDDAGEGDDSKGEATKSADADADAEAGDADGGEGEDKAEKSADDDPVTAAVSKALGPVLEAITGLAETVKAQGEKIEGVVESSAKSAERLETLETKAQTRKSVDTDDGNVPEETQKDAKAKETTSKLDRNLMGMRRPVDFGG